MTTISPLLLATEGFGLNTDIFDTNIINLIIVIAVLVWFLKGFLGGILERRRESILADLKDAEERLVIASKALEEGRLELSQAQATALKIISDGKQRAMAIREDSERRTIEEMARIKQDAVSNLSAEAARVVEALRLETARSAMEKALLNSLATPYADALLQVGEAAGGADALAVEAKALLDAWHSSADLQGAMRSPVLALNAKKSALVAMFGASISPSMLNLLKVLVDRQRIGILDAVLNRFLELYRELRGITLAKVISATALSKEQQLKLTEKVKAMAGTNSVDIELSVDPTLIGGFVVQLGSQVVDASLLGQVKRLGLSLARAA